jgi:thymidylate kinase
MRIIPIRVWDSTSRFGNGNGSSDWRKEPASIPKKERNGSIGTRNLQPFALDNILASSQIIIVEGISGSGKDTFQKYLKSKLRSRVVHDYSEGEILWSWKHQQIKDIFKMQIRLMKNFLDYAAVTLERDDKSLFLLNRFHLSTYTMYTSRITEQPKLAHEYNMVVKALRALPTHVFLLQLLESEMETRSSHPERGIAWRSFQQHILQREGFGNFVKRNVTLQKSMIETAIRQNIPFSILRLPSEPKLEIAVRPSPTAKIAASLNTVFEPLAETITERKRSTQEAI